MSIVIIEIIFIKWLELSLIESLVLVMFYLNIIFDVMLNSNMKIVVIILYKILIR